VILRQQVREAAGRLGFALQAFRHYLRRVPGAPANTDWYEVRLHCPCGRAKTIHIRRESLHLLPAELEDHLRRDGLLT
jgi:hypothetical protein